MFAGTQLRVWPDGVCEVGYALFPGRPDALDLLSSSLSPQDLSRLIGLTNQHGVAAGIDFAKARRRQPLRRVIKRRNFDSNL
jgi:hypothetical protein